MLPRSSSYHSFTSSRSPAAPPPPPIQAAALTDSLDLCASAPAVAMPIPTHPNSVAHAQSGLPAANKLSSLPRSISLQRLNQQHRSSMSGLSVAAAAGGPTTAFAALSSQAASPFSAHATPLYTPHASHASYPHPLGSPFALSKHRPMRSVSSASIEVLEDDDERTTRPTPRLTTRHSAGPQLQSPIAPAPISNTHKVVEEDIVAHTDDVFNNTHTILLDNTKSPTPPPPHTGAADQHTATSSITSSPVRGAADATDVPSSPALDAYAPASVSADAYVHGGASVPISIGGGAKNPTLSLAIPPGNTPDNAAADGSNNGIVSLPNVISEGFSLIHQPSTLLSPSSSSLPSVLIEQFDLLGRAGGDDSVIGSGNNATCESWIVKSKSSGRLAVFKPRDGEVFEEMKAYQAEKERREAEEKRRRRFGAAAGRSTNNHNSRDSDNAASSSALSTSCPLPHPLSIPTSLRTPVKRGVYYGETSRKEVAAYLLDHAHFAGVPRTVEATIWLQQHAAPNGGRALVEGSLDHAHPYLPALPAPALQITAGEKIHPQSSPTRLLLTAASTSPSNSSTAPHASSVPSTAVAHQSFVPTVPAHECAALNRSATDSHCTTLMPPPPAPAHRSTDSSDSHASPQLQQRSAHSSASTTASHSPDCIPMSTPAASGATVNSDSLSVGLGTPACGSSLVPTYGSLQEYVDNVGSAEDVGPNSFSTEEVHRIGILDIRLLNLDRHLGNLLVQRDPLGKPHLVPIDHSFCLPSYTDLRDVHLEWSWWRQCNELFSAETKAYIAALNPLQDAQLLLAQGIRHEQVLSMVFSTLLLQQAAAEGLNLHHISMLVQRDGDGEEESPLERIVARVLGFQQQASPDDGDSPSSTATSNKHASPSQSSQTSSSSIDSKLASVSEEDATSDNSTSMPHVDVAAAPHSSTESSVNNTPTCDSPQKDHSAVASAAAAGAFFLRSHSDGAVCISDGNSREHSSPASAPAKAHGDCTPTQSRPPHRRKSVADAARQVIELFDSANNSSASCRNSPHGPVASVGNVTAIPRIDSPLQEPVRTAAATPPFVRISSFLRDNDNINTNTETASTAMTASATASEAKLAHLLRVTNQVITEEVTNYRRRAGLLPVSTASISSISPTQMDASSPPNASAPVAAAPAATPAPTTASSPPKMTRAAPSPRANVTVSSPPTVAPVVHRSRSSSVEGASAFHHRSASPATASSHHSILRSFSHNDVSTHLPSSEEDADQATAAASVNASQRAATIAEPISANS